MHSYDYSQQSDDYQRIEKAIQYLEANFKSQPTLEKIAESVHLEEVKKSAVLQEENVTIQTYFNPGCALSIYKPEMENGMSSYRNTLITTERAISVDSDKLKCKM
jgi:hypothetical protein